MPIHTAGIRPVPSADALKQECRASSRKGVKKYRNVTKVSNLKSVDLLSHGVIVPDYCNDAPLLIYRRRNDIEASIVIWWHVQLLKQAPLPVCSFFRCQRGDPASPRLRRGRKSNRLPWGKGTNNLIKARIAAQRIPIRVQTEFTIA